MHTLTCILGRKPGVVVVVVVVVVGGLLLLLLFLLVCSPPQLLLLLLRLLPALVAAAEIVLLLDEDPHAMPTSSCMHVSDCFCRLPTLSRRCPNLPMPSASSGQSRGQRGRRHVQWWRSPTCFTWKRLRAHMSWCRTLRRAAIRQGRMNPMAAVTVSSSGDRAEEPGSSRHRPES